MGRGHWRAAALAIMACAFAGCQRPSAEGPGGVEGGEPSNEFRAVRPDPEAFGPPAEGETRAFYEGDFEAVGSEPDWQLTLAGEVASFQRTGLDEIMGLPGPRDIRARAAVIDAEPLTIILRAGACEHTEGQMFPYFATVQFDGVSYEGCARRAEGVAGETPRWSAAVEGLLPAIDACLERASAKPARVTIAFEVEQGQAVVRLLDAEGGRYECRAPAAGGEVASFETIADRDVIDGERDPLFTRAPTAPPEGRCLESAPALDAAGAAIGFLTTRTC